MIFVDILRVYKRFGVHFSTTINTTNLKDTAADHWYSNPKFNLLKYYNRSNLTNTLPKVAEKKSKANQTECLIYEEAILEPEEKTDGHDAVFCGGDCQGWMHRQCARFIFDKLGELSMPYLCTYCTLNKQYKEFCSLKDTVETLTNI